MDMTITSPQNAVLINGCTLDDIERMVDKAIDKRMEAFYARISDKRPALIRRKEAAARLGISLPTLAAYAKAGFLHAKHVGGRVFFAEDEIEKYLTKTKNK